MEPIVGKFAPPRAAPLLPVRAVPREGGKLDSDGVQAGHYCANTQEQEADKAYKEHLIASTSLSKEAEVIWKGKDPYVSRLVASSIKPRYSGFNYKDTTATEAWQMSNPGAVANRLRVAEGGASGGGYGRGGIGDSAAWDWEPDVDAGPMVRDGLFRTLGPTQRLEQEAVGWSRSQPCDPVVPCDSCPAGHALERYTTLEAGYTCEKCGPIGLPKFTVLYGCRICDYDLCSVHGKVKR